MDLSFIKGCFFLGVALIELGCYDEAIKQLQRGKKNSSKFRNNVKCYHLIGLMLSAHSLTKEKKKNYGDDITSQLRRARRLKWEKQEEVRQNQEIELLVNNSYLLINCFIS